MSTRSMLAGLEANGDLIRFEPVFDQDECEKRRLFLSKDIHNCIYNPPKSQADYYANVRAVLASYVKGDEIEDDELFLKRLDARGDRSLEDIWEIKIRFTPQSRLFGAFAGPDCFVALTPRLREKCPFKQAMLLVDKEWSRLFPGMRRFKCWPLANCISFVGA